MTPQSHSPIATNGAGGETWETLLFRAGLVLLGRDRWLNERLG